MGVKVKKLDHKIRIKHYNGNVLDFLHEINLQCILMPKNMILTKIFIKIT